MQEFDRALCCRQLRYSGMMETARIRQAGYPVRYSYKEFVDRYRPLSKTGGRPKADLKETTDNICAQVFQPGTDYQLGNTKLFLKEGDNEFLEAEYQRVVSAAVLLLQQAVRGWLCRSRFLKLKQSALVIQKNFRARGFRAKYLVMRNGYCRLQARINSRLQRGSYQKLQSAVLRLHSRCRGYLVRKYHRFGKMYSITCERSREEQALKQQGNKRYKDVAQANYQKRIGEVNMEDREDTMSVATPTDDEIDILFDRALKQHEQKESFLAENEVRTPPPLPVDKKSSIEVCRNPLRKL